MCLVNIPGDSNNHVREAMVTDRGTYELPYVFEITPELSVTMAEEQTSIADGKDHFQGEPTRESFCQNPEHLGGAAGEEQEDSTLSARCNSVEVA